MVLWFYFYGFRSFFKEQKSLLYLNVSRNSLIDLEIDECEALFDNEITINFSFNKLFNPGIPLCLLKIYPGLKKLNLSHNLFRQFTLDWNFMNTFSKYQPETYIEFVVVSKIFLHKSLF